MFRCTGAAAVGTPRGDCSRSLPAPEPPKQTPLVSERPTALDYALLAFGVWFASHTLGMMPSRGQS